MLHVVRDGSLFLALSSLILVLGCDSSELSRLDRPSPDAATLPPPYDGGVPEPRPDASQPAPDATVLLEDAGLPPAREVIYAHTAGDLYTFEPMDFSAKRVGSFNLPAETNMVDIAIDRMGRMFGGDDGSRIYRINPETGAATQLFQITMSPTGMTSLSDGRIIISSTQMRFLNPNTGSLEATIAAPSLNTSGDIIGLPDGNLYLTVDAYDSLEDLLYRVNPTTGQASRIGKLESAEVLGLAFANGRMFGFARSGEVMEINPMTGATIQSRTMQGAWFGATTNPVTW